MSEGTMIGLGFVALTVAGYLIHMICLPFGSRAAAPDEWSQDIERGIWVMVGLLVAPLIVPLWILGRLTRRRKP